MKLRLALLRIIDDLRYHLLAGVAVIAVLAALDDDVPFALVCVAIIIIGNIIVSRSYSERLSRVAFSLLPDCVMTLDEDCKITGYLSQGKFIDDRSIDMNAICDQALLAGNKVIVFKYKTPTSFYEMRATRLSNSLVLLVARDITTRVTLERALQISTMNDRELLERRKQ